VARLLGKNLIRANYVKRSETFEEDKSYLHAYILPITGTVRKDTSMTFSATKSGTGCYHRGVIVHHVVLALGPDGQALDVVGPADVFTAANLLGATPPYRMTYASASGGKISFSNGLSVETKRLSAIRSPIDTLIVGGGLHIHPRTDPLVGQIARRHATTKRTASVCTGAFLLAEAGVLNGRSATTHWSSCARLAQSYPAVNVVAERIFIDDDDVWTSAGVTAGMDLAVAIVSADHSPELAREIARWLVIYLQRPGGQSQFSQQIEHRTSTSGAVTPALAWIAAHLDGDCSVERLAEAASMSPRHLTRTFVADMGMPPAKYVHLQRLHRAKTLLETTSFDVTTVARRCGFTRAETFHRSFRQQFGVTPAQHRQAFTAG
jgi:transcriptional regulator GlxA family with amidase domain